MSAVRSPYIKGDFYDSARITPGVDNVVSMRDEEEHKAMRARMAPAVSHPLLSMALKHDYSEAKRGALHPTASYVSS